MALGGFRWDQVAQAAVAGVFAPGLGQGSRLSQQGGVGLFHRQPEARLVQGEQGLALAHHGIVGDRDTGHQAGDVGRDLHHVGAHPAIAGPGLDLIVQPHPAGADDGDKHGGGGHQEAKSGGDGFHRISFRRER